MNEVNVAISHITIANEITASGFALLVMTDTTTILPLTAVGHHPLARRGFSLNKWHLFDASTFWQLKGSQNLPAANGLRTTDKFRIQNWICHYESR